MRILIAILVLGAIPLGFSAPPDVAAILRRLIDASGDPKLTEARNAVSYNRLSRVDYLNEEEQVKKRVTREYVVTPENGRAVTRLVAVNGRPASDKDDFKQSSARETGERSRALVISKELMDRFEYKYIGDDLVNHRRCWMLRFHPRKGAAADGFFDRLINAMAGVIWVDIEDGQLSKADIYLSKKVSFFGGIAGAIERMDLKIVNRRVQPGVWLGESAFIDFAGRKLFSAIRFRCEESCDNFHPETAGQGTRQLSESVTAGNAPGNSGGVQSPRAIER